MAYRVIGVEDSTKSNAVMETSGEVGHHDVVRGMGDLVVDPFHQLCHRVLGRGHRCVRGSDNSTKGETVRVSRQ